MDAAIAAELLRLETHLAQRDWRALATGVRQGPIRPRSDRLVDPEATAGADAHAYAAVLHDDFEEIGASGRHWTRAATLELLVGAPREAVEIRYFRVEPIADGVALALYETAGDRPARRSSLWVRDGDRWRLRFHQGTPLHAAATVSYREAATADLDDAELDAIWALTQAAFPPGDFSRDDLAHAMGGRHFLAEADGRLIGHASVVERVLEADGQPLRTGYVEAVAVHPDRQGQGIASALMAAVGAHIRSRYQLGALGTGHPAFYERLGWRVWAGPTWVRTAAGLVRSEDEDGGILWLPTPQTPTEPPISGDEPISCDWRVGDSW